MASKLVRKYGRIIRENYSPKSNPWTAPSEVIDKSEDAARAILKELGYSV